MTKVRDSLISRLKRGLGAQGFSQLVQVFIRLVEVPLLLGFWGSRLYGEWLMIAAIPAYLALSDGGFAGAASREMAMRSGVDDRVGAVAVFQSTWALLLTLSAGVLLVGTIIVGTVPLGIYLGLEAISPVSIKVVLLLLLVHVLIGFQGGLLYGGFWYLGRYPSGMTWATITQLLEFTGLAGAVVIGGGPVEAAVGYLSGRLLGTVLLWAALHRVTPWLSYGFGRASIGEIKRLAVPAFASLAFPLGNALNIQGLRLVVGLALGPAAVAVFTSIRTLTRLAIQPTSVINRLMEPEMGRAFGKGDNDLFARLFAHSCQASAWLCLAACFALAISGNWLLPFWTGNKVEMDWSLFLLLLATTAVNATWYTALMVPYATNRYGRIAAFYSCVYGGAAFVLAYASANHFGFNGVGAALLIVEIVMAAYVLSVALRLSGQLWVEWIRVIVHPPWWIFKCGLDVTSISAPKGNA